MKKLLSKRRREKESIPSRITNETVAEHRERILAGGRRFKYPMQYARHRLVIVTVSLAMAVFLLLGVVIWWQLYVAQSSNTLLYRITQIIPVPVATVDGQRVRYSDYLMYYNSSIHFLQKSEQLNLNDENGKRQAAFQKRQNLDIAIRNAYAEKLAKEQNITVDAEELKRINQEHLTMANGPISQETYNASTMSLLGWTPEEEQRSTKSQLLKNKVAFAIDDEAEKRVKEAASLLQDPNADFEQVASTLGGEGNSKVTAGASGMVPIVNNDGGLTEAARKLTVGQASPVIRSTTGDGYYFVRLLEKTDTQLNYAYLRIPLTEFDARLEALREAGKIEEYIKVPRLNNPKVQD
jgi:uncharacterized membrane protein